MINRPKLRPVERARIAVLLDLEVGLREITQSLRRSGEVLFWKEENILDFNIKEEH